MKWMEALNRTLRYIEEHLEGELPMAEIARQSGFSQFYLQRVFAMLTDLTLSEYIRQRRLSAAGQALQATDAKVLDTALRFGYETPEAFQKAFRRFHGVTPSAAKRTRVRLRYLNPLQIHISLKGGSIMDYRLEEMGELTLVGLERKFTFDNSFGLIPQFWNEFVHNPEYLAMPCGLGICFDDGSSADFPYMIGGFDEPGLKLPEGFTRRTIQPRLWAKFRSVGPIPKAIQSLNRQIFTEWLPNNPEYELAEGINIEMYTEGDMDADDYVSEIWIPVARK